MRQDPIALKQEARVIVISQCWYVIALLLGAFSLASYAQNDDAENIEQNWEPAAFNFNRYEKMLSKSPFGKPPVKAPPATIVEIPLEEKQLAIAGVSVLEGKPTVYLIDLKTRIYQKINSEEENENKICLVEISNGTNLREVMARVRVDGKLVTVKYDRSILDAKSKQLIRKEGDLNKASISALKKKNGQLKGGKNSAAVTAVGGGLAQKTENLAKVKTEQVSKTPISSNKNKRGSSASQSRRRVALPGQPSQK